MRPIRHLASILALLPVLVSVADAGPVSSPIAVSPDGASVWVVNPDSDTVARIDAVTRVRTAELDVGRYPRTLSTAAGGVVYVASQRDDEVARIAGGAVTATRVLPFGCAPYGVATSAGGEAVYVSCQGSGTLVVLNAALDVQQTVALDWPEPRALAVGPDGRVYVTHFVTKEPNHSGRVSEVDPLAGTVTRVFEIPPDFATCETLASGQGVANLLSAAAVTPDGRELWVGGTLHNVLRKGLFQRSRFFQDAPGAALFPDLDYQSNPPGEGEAARRNIYKPAMRDVARSGLWRIDLASGTVVARLDLTGGGQAIGIGFSPDGTVAHAVDLMANAYYAFSTARGVGGNPATLFGEVAAFGPGGADPAASCDGRAVAVAVEDAFILAPQARLVPTGGMNPLDAATLEPADTGLEFTVATGLMRGVPDGVGTTPIGLAVSPDGATTWVANYLARNVTAVDADAFVCQRAPAQACRTRLDCGANGECMPLVRAVVPSTDVDPLPPELLDGKILFSTAARDAAGEQSPVPPWNELGRDGTTNQGEVTSTARGGQNLACVSCHPDFGGQDGRSWDFAQFGSSLRNTMDLRGRASFAPGTCSEGSEHPGAMCTTDADCGAFLSGSRCTNDPAFIPPNVSAAERQNFFNPMGSIHWNGDRDEVEDFEFTLRELLGASDCDGQEDKPETCVGALITRRFTTDPAPVDVRVDLSPQPNRTRSARLDHLGDFVYSLTEFPRNPNLGPGGTTPSEAARRGRDIFRDAVLDCAFCHTGPAAGRQQFTNKGPNPGYDRSQVPRADLNSPFLRFDVGTTNVFDRTNPFEIANDAPGLLGFTLFQNQQTQVPGNRAALNLYVTPPLVSVWNEAPYLHDGSAPTLLDVVRPCSTLLDDCERAGRGRNVDDQHGVTSFLSARQLNDLAAFEAAPHGSVEEARLVSASRLTVQKLKVRFGKRAGSDALVLRGTAALEAGVRLDPSRDPVTVSIGVPAGGHMAIVERTLTPDMLRAKGTTFRFKDRRGTRAGGLRKLVLKVKDGQVSLRLAAKKTDLAVLNLADPDYTVAVEVGAHTMAQTRGYQRNPKGTVVKGPPKRRGGRG